LESQVIIQEPKFQDESKRAIALKYLKIKTTHHLLPVVANVFRQAAQLLDLPTSGSRRSKIRHPDFARNWKLPSRKMMGEYILAMHIMTPI